MKKNIFTKPAQALFKNLPVLAAYLFGSQTGDYVSEESDYDIALFVEDKTAVDANFIYKTIIDYSIKPDKVHLSLVDLHNTSPFLLYEIIKTGVLLYEQSGGISVKLSASAMQLYYDDQHRRDIFYHYLKQTYAG